MKRGLSKARLERLREALAWHVEHGDVPGLVALVSRDGEAHVEVLGSMSADAGAAPMKRDAIFRIASLTKIVAAVAAMMLVEDCSIRLDDSIERWIPELANRRVLRTIASELDDTVPAQRAITVRDLLTYRMGFGSVMAMPGMYPIQKKIAEHRIGGDGPPRPAMAPTTEEWLKRLASLPLMAQPGERWMYNTSADVLGILIARASGVSLGEFFRTRIFEPLGMKDTGFCVRESELARLPACYRFDYERGSLQEFDGQRESAWLSAPFESAAGGLISTMDDYLAFSEMMLNKGRRGDVEILSRASVELMTSDQLLPEQRAGAEIFFGDFSSWGLGVAVDVRRREIFQTPGRYGWTGGMGTTAYNDPAEGMIGILFTQRMMDSPIPPKVFSDFWTLAYTAME